MVKGESSPVAELVDEDVCEGACGVAGEVLGDVCDELFGVVWVVWCGGCVVVVEVDEVDGAARESLGQHVFSDATVAAALCVVVAK